MAGLMGAALKNREGAVVVIVALCIVVIVGMAAFAIDTGMLFSARSDAQRAADAAALAAASAFYDPAIAERPAVATARGTDYATRNAMIHTPIATSEVQIELLTNTSSTFRVRATVRRPEVQTFFAGIFGKKVLPVSAAAEAEVVNTVAADCLKPFALPDQNYGPGSEYVEGTLVKIWVVGGEDHVLVGFNEKEPPGLGNIEPFISNKCVDGQSAALGDDLLWEKPGNNKDAQGGDGVGQVRNGMEKLLNSDNLTYDEVTKKFSRDDWASSPRVGNVALYDYDLFKNSGTNQVRVVNFARVYFSHDENKGASPNNPYTVWGRIFPLEGLSGDCAGDECAPNAFTIRLVK
jgi:Flp pilus assembly protein TadG